MAHHFSTVSVSPSILLTLDPTVWNGLLTWGGLSWFPFIAWPHNLISQVFSSYCLSVLLGTYIGSLWQIRDMLSVNMNVLYLEYNSFIIWAIYGAKALSYFYLIFYSALFTRMSWQRTRSWFRPTVSTSPRTSTRITWPCSVAPINSMMLYISIHCTWMYL